MLSYTAAILMGSVDAAAQQKPQQPTLGNPQPKAATSVTPRVVAPAPRPSVKPVAPTLGQPTPKTSAPTLKSSAPQITTVRPGTTASAKAAKPVPPSLSTAKPAKAMRQAPTQTVVQEMARGYYATIADDLENLAPELAADVITIKRAFIATQYSNNAKHVDTMVMILSHLLTDSPDLETASTLHIPSVRFVAAELRALETK
jgi:hypothetical protein